MRHTLEQLKAMTDKELWGLWTAAQFPFENNPICGNCLTAHHSRYSQHDCIHHPVLTERITAINPEFFSPWEIVRHENIEELYALRMFYADSYDIKEKGESPWATPATEVGTAKT